jgi:hypothetical protein
VSERSNGLRTPIGDCWRAWKCREARVHREAVAEWILSRVTSREEATAIVGDLLETGAPFWWTVARTALALSGRTWLAVVTAVAALYLMRHLFTVTWRGHITISAFVPCVFELSMVVAFLAVRRGLRDGVTMAAGVLLTLCSIGMSSAKLGPAQVVGWAGVAAWFLCLLLWKDGKEILRRVILILIALNGSGWVYGEISHGWYLPQRIAWFVWSMAFVTALGIAAATPAANQRESQRSVAARH